MHLGGEQRRFHQGCNSTQSFEQPLPLGALRPFPLGVGVIADGAMFPLHRSAGGWRQAQTQEYVLEGLSERNM